MTPDTSAKLRQCLAALDPPARLAVMATMGRAEAQAIFDGMVKPLGMAFGERDAEFVELHVKVHAMSRVVELTAVGASPQEGAAYAAAIFAEMKAAGERHLTGLRAGLAAFSQVRH